MLSTCFLTSVQVSMQCYHAHTNSVSIMHAKQSKPIGTMPVGPWQHLAHTSHLKLLATTPRDQGCCNTALST
jgi:hypothetical protein